MSLDNVVVFGGLWVKEAGECSDSPISPLKAYAVSPRIYKSCLLNPAGGENYCSCGVSRGGCGDGISSTNRSGLDLMPYVVSSQKPKPTFLRVHPPVLFESLLNVRP